MTLTVPAHDHGKIYVFDVDADFAATKPDATRIATALGVTSLNPDYVDLVPLADLHAADTGPLEYLWTGYARELSAEEEHVLNTIPSHMLLILSRAFGEAEAKLTPNTSLRHVATLADPATIPDQTPLTSAAATGILTPEGDLAPPEDRPPSRVYMYALIVIFAFFALMAWRIASGNV